MSKSTAIATLIALLSLLPSNPARAQFFGQQPSLAGKAENMEGFTVSGKGTVAARPDSVEIDLEVSAASELTADAIVKYRDARRKIQEAFAGLKLPNVSVGEHGLLVDKKGQMQSPYFFSGMQNNSRAKVEVQLTRKLVVKATGLRQMEEEKVLQQVSRLLDVAQDAGAKVGGAEMNPYYAWRYDIEPKSGGLVRFVLDDFDKLEDEAFDKAIADARARATRLAKLSGVTLGDVLGVREVNVPADHMASADGEVPRKRLETSKFQEIPIKVELMVRFGINPHVDPKARAGQ
jgi:uncharacterized protein YggE